MLDKNNPQPPVETVIIPGDSQFPCGSCGKAGDRIVGCQNFDGELVGRKKSCADCEKTASPGVSRRASSVSRVGGDDEPDDQRADEGAA